MTSENTLPNPTQAPSLNIEPEPNQTLYIRNLNDKIKPEGIAPIPKS